MSEIAHSVAPAAHPSSAEDTSPQLAANEDEASTGLDGGWGWVVVIGSFTTHVITWGVAYSFGIFVEDFVDYFESSKSAVGGLGSVMIGVVWCSGILYYLSILCESSTETESSRLE